MPTGLDVTLSERASSQCVRVGLEGQPVLVIDEALEAPEGILAAALARAFQPIGPYYPGVRADLGAGVVTALLTGLAPQIADTFALDAARLTGECFLSMVTTPPSALKPIQRLPHYDGVEAERLAMVAYFHAPELGGTSFFRHKATGFESVSEARFAPYKHSLESDIARTGLPPAAFVTDDSPLFDRTATVHARFNRLALYRGNMLHCSATPNDRTLSADPKSGRLTLNAFFYPAEA